MLETSFRIHRDEVTRTLIGCPSTAERQKIGFDILLRNGSYGTTAGRNGNGTTDFLGRQHNSYGAYVILTEFV